MGKDAVLNMRIEPAVKRALLEVALAEERTLARVAERLLREGLERAGYLKPRSKLPPKPRR